MFHSEFSTVDDATVVAAIEEGARADDNMARLRHKTVEAPRARSYDRFVFTWAVEAPSGFKLRG